MIYEAPLLYICNWKTMWLIMWQLHLLNNIQNATYLKSETDIHLLIWSFNCYLFLSFLFYLLKARTKQYWPANRFNRYFRINLCKGKKNIKNATTREQHKRKSALGGIWSSASTRVDKDKVPEHLNTKNTIATTLVLSFKYTACTKLYSSYSKVVTTKRQLPQKIVRVRIIAEMKRVFTEGFLTDAHNWAENLLFFFYQ